MEKKETKNAVAKIDATKRLTPVQAIIEKLHSTDADSVIEMVTKMTNDPIFAKKFVTDAEILINNAWKTDDSGRKTNDFNLCPVSSFFEALMVCAHKRVTPDGYNAYLAVYKGKRPCIKVMVDYKGLIDTAVAERIILSCNAKEIRANDEYEIDFGEITKHKIKLGVDRGEIIGCYARAILPSGRPASVVLDRNELDQIRDCAQTDEVWSKWEVEMFKKSAVRRLFKMLPNTPRLRNLMDLDNEDFDLKKAKPLGGGERQTPIRNLDGSGEVIEGEVVNGGEVEAETAPKEEKPVEEATPKASLFD